MSLFADVPLLLSALAFLSFCLFFLGILHYLRLNARKRELIGKIQLENQQWHAQPIEKASSRREGRIQKAIFGFLQSLGKGAVPHKPTDYSRMRLRFLKAGLHQANLPALFLGTKSFLVIFLPVCLLLANISLFKTLNANLLLASLVVAALLGFYLPDIWLRLKTSTRKNKMLEGLPDVLDLLVVCVEAGMGLDAALSRVGEEIKLTNRVLSDEFRLLNLELRAGKSRQDALRNLAMRTDIEDVNSLVTLLIQADKFGTSVAQALKVYSDAFRTKRYQKAEEIAAKLPVKLIFPLILFIFPALFVALLGPAAIRIYQVLLHR